MIARGFKSVIWVATVGTAALGCYMVSLKVATERADLARVEAQIVAAKQDIRSLQTELGTRGRLSQLEQWNADVLALSAPSSAQFLQNEVTLARFEQADPTLDQRSAEVRMAAAEVPAPAPAAPALPVVTAAAPAPVAAPAVAVHRASFTPVKAEAKAAAKAPTAAAAEPKKAPAKADFAKPAAKIEPTKLAAKTEPKAAGKAEPKKAVKPEPTRGRASRLDSSLTAQIKAAAPQADGGN